MAISLYAQNEAISSLSQYNLMYYNPAYAGDGEEIEAKLLHRSQWLGYPGAPITQFLNADMPFNLFSRKHGVGLSIMNDTYGFWQNISAGLSYAYRKQLMQGEIGIGGGLNFTNFSLSPEWLAGNGDAGTGSSGNDLTIPQKAEKKPIGIDMNLGLFFSNDNMYFSASIRNLLGSDIKWKGQNGVEPTGVSQVFFVSTGYTYQLSNPLFAIQPNFQLLSDFTETAINLNGIFTYNNKFSGGLGFRPRDAVILLAGISLPMGVDVMASYDITTSKLSKGTKGSFEFMLGYKFIMGIDKDARKYKSVRLL